MPINPFEKSKIIWQDMDEFNRNVLAGEYASSSDNMTDVLLPSSYDRCEASAFKEGNVYGTSNEIEKCSPAEKDEKGEMNRKAGAQRGNRLKLPAIYEEELEGAACLEEASPSNEETGGFATLVEDNPANNILYPYSKEDCLHLERQCMITKQIFSKYVSDYEKNKILGLYGRPNSSVVICNSAASLHLSTRNQVWMEQYYGVPVVVVEFVDDSYNLFFLLAERGEGLPLWKNKMTWKSGYTRETSTYHVMHVSQGRRQGEKMGLNFDLEEDATTFWLQLSRLMAHLPGPLPDASSEDPDDSDDAFQILSPKDFQRLMTDRNNHNNDYN